MGKVDNLKPKTTLSKEEAKELGSKGGKASVKARRERKAMREQLEMLLKLPLESKEIKEELAGLGIASAEIDNQMALTFSLFIEAIKGNVKAYEVIRDTIGEKPIEKQEIKRIDTDWFIDK